MNMTYEEAAKAVANNKVMDNFMVIRIDYSTRLVLPFADGVKFVETLKKAEQFDSGYAPSKIEDYKSTALEISILSANEYNGYKMAALLGVTPAEVAEMKAAL